MTTRSKMRIQTLWKRDYSYISRKELKSWTVMRF